MSFTTFLLRLVGRSPEQIAEQERLEKNLKQLDLREEELDDLLSKIRGVDKAYQGKKETLDSMRPAPPKPSKVLGENDVRIAYASEHDLSG